MQSTKEGGIGIPQPTKTCGISQYLSRLMIEKLSQSLEGSSPFNLSDHMKHVVSVRKQAKEANKIRAKEVKDELKNEVSAKIFREIERSTKTGTWLSVSPSPLNDMELSHEEFRDGLALRFGLEPVNTPTNCDGCGELTSLTHAMNCRRGGLIIQRHDAIKHEVGYLAESALSPSSVRDEPTINCSQETGTSEGGADSGERGDLMIRGMWENGTDCIIDLVVTNLESASHSKRAPMKVLATLEKAKKEKNTYSHVWTKDVISPHLQFQ